MAGLITRLLSGAVQSAVRAAVRSPKMARSEVGHAAPQITRPFARDYAQGARSDAAGRLLADIDGRPLTAPLVVGRRTVGGPDVAISSAELAGLADRLAVQIGPAPAAKVVDNAGRLVLHSMRT